MKMAPFPTVRSQRGKRKKGVEKFRWNLCILTSRVHFFAARRLWKGFTCRACLRLATSFSPIYNANLLTSSASANRLTPPPLFSSPLWTGTRNDTLPLRNKSKEKLNSEQRECFMAMMLMVVHFYAKHTIIAAFFLTIGVPRERWKNRWKGSKVMFLFS